VAGVRTVKNLLPDYPTRENISALQGGRHRTGEPAEWRQTNWSPAARFLAGLAGILIGLQGQSAKNKKLVVYCANRQCDSSEKATKKLEEAGFTSVLTYRAGQKHGTRPARRLPPL
jgi:rhodanese-related sulfurtransferase